MSEGEPTPPADPEPGPPPEPAAQPESSEPTPHGPPPPKRRPGGRESARIKARADLFAAHAEALEAHAEQVQAREQADQRSLRERIDWYLNEPASTPGKVIELVVGALIVAVCAIFMINTYDEHVPAAVRDTLYSIEIGITVVFLIEYLIRWWAKGFSVRYLFTPMAIIDFVSILPLFLPAQTQWQVVRVLRLFRVLRLLRLVQSRKFFFGEVTPEHLIVIRILFTIFCLVFITGGLVYELEHEEHPERWKSIFDGLYYAVVTLTTVGFGDLVPVTLMGKIVTMVMILVGVLLIPWQLTNLAKTILEDKAKIECTCIYCGLKKHDRDAAHCKACGNLIYLEYDGDA